MSLHQAFSIAVSGSEDGTVIVWDMGRLHAVRQFRCPPPHPLATAEWVPHAPITGIAINHRTGGSWSMSSIASEKLAWSC